MKTKRPFSMRYKTYDTSQGFGSPREWRAAFQARMGLDEATRTVGTASPWAILNVAVDAPWAAVVRAFRTMALACHPDRCAVHGLSIEAATETFKRLLAAFTVIKAGYQR